MKKQRKKYSRPKKPWDKERIEKEKKILRNFGLRRKREIWRIEEILRDFRRRARDLAASKDEKEEKILLEKVNKLGLISKDSTLDDVLGLSTESMLERRLQTIIFRRGLANTLKQARQFIVHGHIAVDGRRTRWPSQLITINNENNISFYQKSNVKQWLIDSKSEKAPAPKKEEPKPEVKKEETPKEEPPKEKK